MKAVGCQWARVIRDGTRFESHRGMIDFGGENGYDWGDLVKPCQFTTWVQAPDRGTWN
jgi:hypothetical protein